MPENLENSKGGHKTGKDQFSFQSQRKAMPKNAQTTTQLHSSQCPQSIAQISSNRLQKYVNRELPDVQVGFGKGRGTRDQIASIHWIMENTREFQKKTSTSPLLTIPKPLTVSLCGSQQTMENSSRDRKPPEKSVCRSRSNI